MKGRIFNCYSGNDEVLGTVYQTAMPLSEPIGYDELLCRAANVFNFDCSELVDGHMEWKDRFGEIVGQLAKYAR